MHLKLSPTVRLMHLAHLIEKEKLISKIRYCLRRADKASRKGDIDASIFLYEEHQNIVDKLKPFNTNL